MLDISRNRVPTPEWTRWLVRRLARLRYNELQLYTEHTFAYTEHRTVWEYASPWTAEEIRELDTFCRRHHIELVPNQNTFGHMERWLRHDAYRPLAECPDGFVHPKTGEPREPTTLCPGDASFALVAGLLHELLPNFRSGRVNIGGDEPWELGLGRSRGRAETEGKHRVYLDFLKRILECALQNGKTPEFWADIVLERPELVAEIPRSARPAVWGYSPWHPFPEQCATMAEAGFSGRFSVVPGTNTWNAFGGRLRHAADNIALAAREGRAHGADGFLLTAWGDLGHHAPYATNFPALVLGAEAAWHGASRGAEAVCAADSTLGEAVDAAFFDGNPGNGDALLRLGALESRLSGDSQAGFLHRITIRRDPAAGEATHHVSERTLREARDALEAVLARRGDPDDDIATAAHLCHWAIGHALARKTDGPAPDSEAIGQRFRANWLRHSRPGGLDDSLRRLAEAAVP